MIRAACVALVVAFAALAPPVRAEIEIVPVSSPGGIEAWLYEDHSIPILTIVANFLGGAALDAEGQEGTTYLMAALLNEGAGELDAAAFATAREELAARMGVWANGDGVSVSSTMLAESRNATVELLRLALTAPRFDPEAVERVRAQALASVRIGANDPNTLASDAFYALAYPAHPYGRPAGGTSASLAAISLEDLRAAHSAALTRDRLSVAVVGAIGPDELRPLLDRLFGALPETGAELPAVVTPSLKGGTEVIDLDIPQSVAIFGHAGILHGDPDFIPALVMDYVLGGGGFGSRLMSEMREKRGITYGVRTHFAPGHFGGLYMGSFSSSNARAAEGLDILRSEWARMANEGVTEAELVSAKQYLTGEYPLRFDGNARIAEQLLGLQVAGLGVDYVNRRNDLVEAVTVGDVARVAKRLLRPEALTTVIVGRPVGLKAGD